MKITYDSEGDVLYIQLREVDPVDSTDIEEGVTAELDGEGHLVAIEILDASKRMTAEELANIHYENLLLTAAGPSTSRPQSREPLLGGEDGLAVWLSLLEWARAAA